MMIKERFRWMVMATAMAVLLAACAGDDGGDAGAVDTEPAAETDQDEPAPETATEDSASAEAELPDVIQIGVLDDLTGGAAFCGTEEVQGMEVAIAEAEAEGFLGGSTIELVTEDTASTPDGAVSGYESLVASEVPVILGPCVSSAAAAIVQRPAQDNIPLILTTAGAEELVHNEWVYRAGVNQPTFAGETFRILSEMGIGTTAIVFDQGNPSIVELVDSVFVEAAEEHGIEITDQIAITAETQDLSAQIAQIRESNPDAIGILTVGQTNVTVLSQIREAGLEQPVWGQIGMYAEYFVKDGGELTDGVIFAVNFAHCFGSASEAFNEGFEEMHGKTPGFPAANGYDAMWMALEAIKAAGSLDPGAVNDALTNLESLNRAQGEITFDDQGDAVGSGGVVRVAPDSDSVECLTG